MYRIADGNQNFLEQAPEVSGASGVVVEGGRFRCEIAALGELHLDGMDSGFRTSIVARCPATLEAAVDHMAALLLGADRRDRSGELGGAGLAAVGADVEFGQATVEQLGDDAADRMRLVEDDGGVEVAQAIDLGAKRIVIGIEIGGAAARDLGFVGFLPRPVERVAVEGDERAEAGGELARIERLPAGIAVDVDDGAGGGGAYQRRAELERKGVELVDLEVGIVARASRRNEPGRDLLGNLEARMRNADDQRPFAAHGDDHGSIPGSPSPSTPLFTSAVASAMSGAKWRSSSRCGT